MRIRRMLATLLCLAMIMTSGAFTTVVGAQEANGQADNLTISVEQEEPVSLGSEQAAETVAEDPNASAGQDAGAAETEQPAKDETTIEETSVQEEPEVTETVEEPVEEEPEETEEAEETEETELVEEPEEAEETTEDEELLGVKPSEPTPGFDGVEWKLDTPMPETILLPPGVTEIPVGVFNLSDYEDADKNQLARNVKNIYFSDGDLATIKAGAFKNSNVAMIAFEEDLDDTPLVIEQNAFDGCTNLKQIDLDSVETIAQNAFRGCTSLSSVDLSAATIIEEGAFQNCTALGSVNWSADLTSIGENAFSGCALTTLRIGELNLLTTIGDTAFSDNVKLTEVNLPKNLTAISFGMFKNCSYLSNVTFTDLLADDNQIESVGSEAFSGCIALQKIELACNIRSIGNKAFNGCEAKLLNIYFHTPDGVIEFDENAFPGRSDAKATMYGYESEEATVRDYAASKGYQFKSLAIQYEIRAISNQGGTITPSLKKAPEGAEVLLTVVPTKGYSFTNIKIKYKKNNSDTYVYPELIKSNSQRQIYRFIMPACDPSTGATIDAKYDTAKNILNGKLGWKFVPSTAGEPDSNTLTFPTAGGSAKIVVDVSGTEIGLWNFDLSTSDKEVATISQFGVITGLKKGTAIISLASPTEKAKKIVITVSVGENISVDALRFDEYFLANMDENTIKDGTIIEPDPTGANPYANPKYYVVEFNMNKIAVADHTFVPHVCAYHLDEAHDLPDPDPEAEPDPTAAKEIYVNTEWIPRDTKMVTVETAKSSLNENKITIKKGTYGESIVYVRYKNDDGTVILTGFIIRVINSTPRMKDKIVQINAHLQGGTDLNYENVYNYDFYKEGGLEVHTTRIVRGVPIYSYKPAIHASYQYDGLGKVCGISLSADPKLLNLKEGGKTTFSGDTMLYVEGRQGRIGEDGTMDMTTITTFHMPISSVEVFYQKPKANLTYTGKINLLYNSNNTKIDETNFVTVYHNVKNINNPVLEMENLELISEANYKFKQGKGEKEVPDKFASNFVFEPVPIRDTKSNHIGFRIRVNPDIIEDSDFMKGADGRIVSKGYVSIKFKGYNEPIVLPITIPCTYKFPNYVLSRTRVTADSRRSVDPKYKVYIKDADARNAAVDLYKEDDVTSLISDDGLRLDELNTKPMSFFSDPVQLPREYELDDNGKQVKDKNGNPIYKDYIELGAGGYARDGKERFLLQMKDWRKPMSFDFTILSTKNMATATCTPSTATVNLHMPSQYATIKVKYSLVGTLWSDDSEFIYAGPAGKEDVIKNAAELIDLSWDATKKEEPVIKVSVPAGFTRPGSYVFKTTPLAKYGEDGTEFEMKTIRFTVRVIKTRPVLSLKPSTFTLNTRYPNIADDKGEIAEAETSVKNMPKEYLLDAEDIHLVAITKDLPAGWQGDTLNRDDRNRIITDDDGNATFSAEGDWRNSLKIFVIEENIADEGETPEMVPTTRIGVKLLRAHPDAFNYDYYLYGLKYKANEGDEGIENEKPIRIRIACHDRFETLALTPNGHLNQIIPDDQDPDPDIKSDVPGYKIVYNETMKNLHGTVDHVKLAELYPKATSTCKDGDGKAYSPHFLAVCDPKKKTITITLNPDTIMGDDENDIPALENGKDYTLYLYYHIPEKGIEDETAADYYEQIPIKLKVTPKVVLPKLKQVGESCNMYAGWSAEQRVFTFYVGKTNYHTAVFADAIQEDEDPEDPDTYVFDPHDTVGNQKVTKIPDSANAGIRRAFYVKSVEQWETDPVTGEDVPIYMRNINGRYVLDENNRKIPCAKITVALEQPAMLVAGNTYTLPIEIRYENQPDNLKGTIINYKVTVLK